VLGILTKVTTFPAFAVLGGILVLGEGYAAWRAGLSFKRIRIVVVALLILAVPFIMGIAWTVYSDFIKMGNEIGAQMTSSNLVLFTFGTLDQRIGPQLWRDVIWHRALRDIFGYAAVPAVALIAATLIRRQYVHAALAAVAAFLVPFLVFTNLHMVHSYYQASNAIFIVAAVGLGMAALMSSKRVFVALIALVCLAGVAHSQVSFFRAQYAFLLNDPPLYSDSALTQLRIGQIVKSVTPPDTSLIVLGADWSGLIPYYAERKSMVIPYWMPLSFYQRVFAAPQSFLDGVRLGGIVDCVGLETSPPNAEYGALLKSFTAGRAVLGESKECRLLAPDKS